MNVILEYLFSSFGLALFYRDAVYGSRLAGIPIDRFHVSLVKLFFISNSLCLLLSLFLVSLLYFHQCFFLFGLIPTWDPFLSVSSLDSFSSWATQCGS